MYLFNKIVLALVNPETIGAVVMVFGGFTLVRGRVRFGLWLVIGGMIWFGIWGMGVTQRFMGWCFGLNHYRVEDVKNIPKADYIVDLGGGMGIDTNICCYPYVSIAADRAWHSARLWKAGKALFVIPTGFGIENTDRVFLEDLGVPSDSILVENRARNTEENAAYTAELVEKHRKSRPRNLQISKPRILLVTSVCHMHRALMIFKKKAPGLECIPVATDYDGVNFFGEYGWRDFIPSSGTFSRNMVIYKECLGVLGYKMRGF